MALADNWKGDSLIRGRRPSPKTTQTQEACHMARLLRVQQQAAGRPVEANVKHASWYRWALGGGK